MTRMCTLNGMTYMNHQVLPWVQVVQQVQEVPWVLVHHPYQGNLHDKRTKQESKQQKLETKGDRARGHSKFKINNYVQVCL